MSYRFIVYTDRESIAMTQVYSSDAEKTYTYNYGTGQREVNGFTDGSYLKFTAVPADGYEFYRWAYHIGSPTATTQYVYANEDEDDPSTFKYYGSTGEDIFIAAEGKEIGSDGPDEPDEPDNPDSDLWSIRFRSPKTYSGHSYSYESLYGYEALCIAMKFKTSGIATFYTESDCDTIGYLTYECDDVLMDNYGVPIADEILADNDDDGTGYNFSISHYVEANTVYWLWLRVIDVFDTSEINDLTCHIIAPGDENYFEWSSAVYSGGVVKNVSHTEWDNFIDKIKEVLTDKGILNQAITAEKYGYAIGTTYNTMLNDCYLEYDSDLQGYPLTAQQFNVARFIIGSHVSTNLDEPEKISRQSEVLAADFFKLSQALRTWQG